MAKRAYKVTERSTDKGRAAIASAIVVAESRDEARQRYIVRYGSAGRPHTIRAASLSERGSRNPID
jgi:hypothetical protein